MTLDSSNTSTVSALPRDELQQIRPSSSGLFGRLGGLGEAVVELIVDRELRRRASLFSKYLPFSHTDISRVLLMPYLSTI